MEAQTVEQAINNYEDLDSWNTVMFLYNAALQEVSTKLNILNEEFQHIHRYNPIEHIGTRIKSPESIVKKLKKNGHESSIENMIRYVNDIAGVRLICSFTSDIYKLAKMIASQNDLKVLEIKDYIKNPKQSGYKSYHMIVTVPIFLSDHIVEPKVEIQIRTIAMDFWASLEHKLHYKHDLPPERAKALADELRDCAERIENLDQRMQAVRNEIATYNEENPKESEFPGFPF